MRYIPRLANMVLAAGGCGILAFILFESTTGVVVAGIAGAVIGAFLCTNGNRFPPLKR